MWLETSTNLSKVFIRPEKKGTMCDTQMPPSFSCRNLSSSPTLSQYLKVRRTRDRLAVESNAVCFCYRNVLGLPPADKLAFRLRHIAEELQYNVRDQTFQTDILPDKVPGAIQQQQRQQAAHAPVAVAERMDAEKTQSVLWILAISSSLESASARVSTS